MHMESQPVQIDIEDLDFHKDTTNIFEEIENLLKNNKTLESDSSHTTTFSSPFDIKNFYTAPQEVIGTSFTPNNNNNNPFTISTSGAAPTLDFLPPCTTHDFLLPPPEETHSCFNEDPLLFSVEHGELQPITSPFMVPGIYKKISTASTSSASSALRQSGAAPASGEPHNVFISETESCGRIVSIGEFRKLYALSDEYAEMPRRVLLLEQQLEQVDSNAVDPCTAKPSLSVLQNNKLIPKQWDALSKLAYNILKLSNRDHIVIDRKRNEIVRTESGTNQKTIYRFLAPQALGVKNPHRPNEQPQKLEEQTAATNNCHVVHSAPTKPKVKIGRPRRPPAEAAVENHNNNIKKVKPALQKTKTSTQSANKAESKSAAAVPPAEATKQPELRTRSGRVVRVVKHNTSTASSTTTTTTTSQQALADADDPPEASAELMRSFLAELRDSDFRCSQTTPIKEDNPTHRVPLATSSPTETTPPAAPQTNRRVPPESVCPTCKKIFLGRRLQRHFASHPDHMKVAPQPPPPLAHSTSDAPNIAPALEDMTLFRFLTAKLQRSALSLSEDQRADLFLAEINDLVKQLQLRSSRLVRNTSGLHFVSARASRVLGIPEGQYALDMSAIERAPTPPLSHPEIETISPTSVDHDQGLLMLNFDANAVQQPLPAALPTSVLSTQRSLDYTALSMSIDDTLTDEAAQKLNLSAGGKLLPPSEDSLLRAVDDLLVSDVGMKKLMHPPMCSMGNEASTAVGSSSSSSSSLVPHYDHASDNAVEALTMKDTSNVVTQQHQQQQQQQAPPLPPMPPMLDLSVDYFQFNSN